MAKVINSDVASKETTEQPSMLFILILGIISGVLYILTEKSTINSGLSLENSAAIASILVCFFMMMLGAATRIRRPIIISILVMISLWNLYKITSEFGFIVNILICLLLYMISFLLFSWIARYKKPYLIFLCGLIVAVICYLISAY